MGKSQRTKGISYERAIARRFRDLDESACRNYENLPGATLGHDVEACGFLIQCKKGKGYAPINKIFEVQSTKGIPLLITKADYKPDMVCISLDAFMEFLKENVVMLNVLEELQAAIKDKKEKLIKLEDEGLTYAETRRDIYQEKEDQKEN